VEAPARTLPRAVDISFAALALLALAPLMLGIAISIAISSRGPVLFSQFRVGRHGELFRIHKFRTLEVGSDELDRIAPEGDPRVTRLGRFLRHSRLDELPQLYDVLRGHMALVGPRPELAANLNGVDRDLLATWLAVRPGLTGAAQLAFIAEDELLAHVADPTACYRSLLVPAKVRYDVEWFSKRSCKSDLALLLHTPIVLASRRAHSRAEVERLLQKEPA